jgi:Peptidase family M23
MYRTVGFIALMLVAFPLVGWSQSTDQFTPVVASPLLPETERVLGTDGQDHVVYELVLANTSQATATLQKIEVLDARDPSVALAAYEGDALLSRLRTLGNTRPETPEFDFNETRLVLLHLAFGQGTVVPHRLVHRVAVLGATSPADLTPVLHSYTVAPVPLSPQIPVVGPPLVGQGWVAGNGCCEAEGVHRNTGLPVNGQLYYAQRYAIDWVRLDAEGRVVHGDLSEVRSYTAYGADIVAVADGIIVEVRNDLEDQVPPFLPDPKTITPQTLLGNHVIQDIGQGAFAFYAHVQKGSVAVAPGDRVTRGQRLGKIGNSGNTSAPHLHFHIMAGASASGSNGIPYVIDGFALAGQIPADASAGLESRLGSSFNQYLFPQPIAVERQFPLDAVIVDFTP